MNIEFAFPNTQTPWWFLLGVLLLAGAGWGLRRLETGRLNRLHAFVEAGLASRLLPGYDARIRRPLFWLTLLGCAFLLLTLAQPRWGQAWMEMARGSRDIIILLDTSESMNAENPLPNRMTRARQKIQALMDECPGDRFSLVAFSGEAVVQCPLTLDHGYLRSILNVTTTDTLSSEGTNIEAALEMAAHSFLADHDGGSASNRHNRAILLISDGEQVAGNAVTMAEEIGEYAPIYVMGIGDPNGAYVSYPQWMLNVARRRGGGRDLDKPHLSKLDEETLSNIAVQSGGVYVRTTPDNSDVTAIKQEIETMASRAVSSDIRFRRINRYRWPLAGAVICFMAEGIWVILMPLIRRRRMKKLELQGGDA